MPFVPAICTQCGAPILVDDTKEAGICQHCNTAFITEKAIYNYNYINNTTNINNTNNTYNVKDSEVHIHSQYDDAETLYKNIDGLLERGYAKNSEAVTNNLKTLEEKFPTDYRTDEARWLVKKDEVALMRTRECDKDFFYKYADEIADQERIASFREFDRDLFDKNCYKITKEELMYKLKDEYPEIAKKYQSIVDAANAKAKEVFLVEFTGDMHKVKEGAVEMVKYVEKHKNDVYDWSHTTGIYDKMCEYSKVLSPFLSATVEFRIEQFGEDRAFMQQLVAWFEQCYAKYAQTKYSAIQRDNLDELIPKLKAKWGTGNSPLAIVRYWDEFYRIWKDTSIRDAYEYLERTKNAKGAPKYAARFQSENFKKGFFGVKQIINDPVNDPLGLIQTNRERVIEESLKHGVN